MSYNSYDIFYHAYHGDVKNLKRALNFDKQNRIESKNWFINDNGWGALQV